MSVRCKMLVVSTLLLAINLSAKTPVQAVNNDVELFKPVKRNAARLKGIMPPNVKTVACISPGSYPGKDGYRHGIELLRAAGYTVKVMPHAFEKPVKGKGSAALKHRLADFYAAWLDKDVDMILCIRGGRGCEELMKSVDWTKLPKRPELYVQGYSDVTMILCALQAKGYGHPIAGPMVGAMTGLNRHALNDMRKMHNHQQVGPFTVEPLVPGDCAGLPIAGLLSRFSWVVKGNMVPSTKGRIIFIESVAATPGEIKEYFQTLLDAKFFDGAAGVVFCCFTRTGNDGAIPDLLKEVAPKIGVPVYMGFPFGHRNISRTIDYQRQVIIRNNKVFFPAPAATAK